MRVGPRLRGERVRRVTVWEGSLVAASAGALLVGLALAAASDLRTREVTDRLWQGLGVVGGILGALALAPGGFVAVAAWIAVAALVVEHTVAWDEALPESVRPHALGLEAGGYGVVLVGLALAVARYGVGPTGVPVAVLAVLVTVLFARLLYQFQILYGFADAKALMLIGLLVPTFGEPWFSGSTGSGTLLAWMPFAITALTDGALLSVALPLALAVRNLRRGEFTFPRGFTGYSLEVAELPRRFVWVRDPELDADLAEEVEEADTSDEDTRLRAEAARRFLARGVTRVWVSPQVPYVVLLALGTLAGLLAGNLVLDLRAVL
jgi:hypothetical protein